MSLFDDDDEDKLTQSPLGQQRPTLLPEFIQPPFPAAGAAEEGAAG